MSSPKNLSHTDQNGLRIENLGASNSVDDAVNKGELNTAEAAAKARTNHTGTQTASTISDFDTQVRTSRLDQLANPTADVSLNSRKITNLLDGSVSSDAVNKGQLDAAVAGIASGSHLKGTVRAVVTTNVNTSAPGTTLDGLTAAANDIFFLTAQTTTNQNGPWTWNSSGGAMTRPANWDTSGEAILGSYWIVREGTSADLFAMVTNDTAITLGTTAITTIVRGAGGGNTSYGELCGVVSAGGTWTITHNLGSRRVIVQIMREASPYDVYGPGQVRIATPTTNTATIEPDVAFGSGDFYATVTKVL